jgi:cytochrome c heme-lyase
MGNATSSASLPPPAVAPPTPAAAAAAAAPQPASKVCPISKTVTPAGSSSMCPFGFGGSTDGEAAAPSAASPAACPVPGPAGPATPGSDGCPARRKDGTYINQDQFNVYSQKLDPSNNMPTNANQQKAPGQTEDLSIDRVQSQIPKGGTEGGTWLYPSPQMFWNAIVRKDKKDGDDEVEHMGTVVAIHNNMNEKTWKQIMAWETLNGGGAAVAGDRAPKLLRFIGRPDEMTPKATFRTWLGQPEPFDRHDWTVDRGGDLVRYVIDYYFDEQAVGKDSVPRDMHDAGAVRSIRVDARPALDSPGAVLDQFVRMPLETLMGNTDYSPPPLFTNISLLNRLKFSATKQIAAPIDLSGGELLQHHWDLIQKNCKVAKDDLAACSSAADPDMCVGAKSIALRRCTAAVVCPALTATFDSAVQAKVQDVDAIAKAYEDMTDCLDIFHHDSQEFLANQKSNDKA